MFAPAADDGSVGAVYNPFSPFNPPKFPDIKTTVTARFDNYPRVSTS